MKNGKRIDDRLPKELRPIKFEVGALQRADGSCYVEQGGNKIMAAVYGPRQYIRVTCSKQTVRSSVTATIWRLFR